MLEITLRSLTGEAAYLLAIATLEAQRVWERHRKQIEDEVNARFEAQIITGPKKKLKSEAIVAKVRAEFQPEVDWLSAEWRIIRRTFDELLRYYSLFADVPKSERMQHVTTHYKSTWSTQGYGAENYARNAAQQEIDRIEANGYTGELRVCPGGQFEVLVNVATRDDWDILRLKPGLSLAEQIRLCWKRGVNPRVYQPFLPHGLEEKLGIDFQGNYKEKK